jgi:hypothetical protein
MTDASCTAPKRRLRVLSQWLSASALYKFQESLADNPELIPLGFNNIFTLSTWADDHIAWMQRKYVLEQDMFLIGHHSPLKRWLAMEFCQRLGREME